LLLFLCLVGCSSPAHPVPALARSDGDVRLWQDASIFQLVGGLIGSARVRVLVEMYELGRADVLEKLGEAVGRGVGVRVITDPTVGESRRAAAVLMSLGVPQRAYPVDDGRHQIDHVKLLIADDEAVVGGMNWGAHSDRNHDYVLETSDAVEVDRLVRIFEQDWSLAGGEPSLVVLVFSGFVASTFANLFPFIPHLRHKVGQESHVGLKACRSRVDPRGQDVRRLRRGSYWGFVAVSHGSKKRTDYGIPAERERANGLKDRVAEARKQGKSQSQWRLKATAPSAWVDVAARNPAFVSLWHGP